MVERANGAGDHGADVYHNAGAETALVDIGETANNRLLVPNRWSLAVCQVHGDAGESDTVDVGVNGGENRSATATGGSDPPDPAD